MSIRCVLLIAIAFCGALTVEANAFTDAFATTAEPVIRKTHATRRRDVSADFDAVKDFIFTDDAEAFRNGRSTVLKTDNSRFSAHGHTQPFETVLHLAFTAHGRKFTFDALTLNHHIWGPDFKVVVEDHEAGAKTEYFHPKVTAYAGDTIDGDASATVVVCPDTHRVHANVMVHSTGELFRLDHLERHEHNAGQRQGELAAAAGAHGMVLLRDSKDDADSILVHHDGSQNVQATVATGTAADPVRKLLVETRLGKTNDAKRWTGCYKKMSKGYRASVGIAIDSEWYRQAKSWGGYVHQQTQMQKVVLEVAEIISDTNLLYNAQMNIGFTVGQTVVQKTPGGPSWNMKPKSKGRRPQVNWSNRCENDDAEVVLKHFDNWRKDKHKSDQAMWHFFSGCTYGGTLGIAWVGTLCKTSLSTAMTTGFPNGHDACWKTVAHEKGHTFGAQHSFEEGQGKTGGIMDYGNGKLDGIYQFNTKYRKAEVCKVVQKAMSPGWFSFGSTNKCFSKK